MAWGRRRQLRECILSLFIQQIRSFTNNLWCIFVIRYPCFVFVLYFFFGFIFWSARSNSRARAETKFTILGNGPNAARLCVRLLIGLHSGRHLSKTEWYYTLASFLFFHHCFANAKDEIVFAFLLQDQRHGSSSNTHSHTHTCASQICSAFNESMFCVSFTCCSSHSFYHCIIYFESVFAFGPMQ